MPPPDPPPPARRPAGDMGALLDELRAIAEQAGLAALGVAPADPFEATRRILEERKAAGLHGGMHFTYGDPRRSTDPQRSLPGARALVVGAFAYLREGADAVAGDTPLARVARYSWRDFYTPLRDALGAVAARLEEAGYRTRVLADDNALVDREAAHRAGLGWYGKNANLLLPGRGSWFVLGAVVTDAPLPPSREAVADGCGTCERCLTACPTGALVAPGVLDARRCLAWLLEAPGVFPREHRVALGDRLYGCDDCQEVCPPNRAAARHHSPPAAAPGDEPSIPALEVLAASDDELLDRFGRWYIPRRQARYVRRNALVVLGNAGDGRHPEVEQALVAALADDDSIVRAHAVWAAGRLGRTDLLPASDPDPVVQAELDELAVAG